MFEELSVKVICITGCSSGLGLELATRLSKQYHVFATVRDLRRATVLKKCSNLDLIELDVCSKESIVEAFKKIEQKVGRLDVLINNAGIMHMGFFDQTSMEKYRQVMETNFFGALQVTLGALNLLKKGSRSKIINISSTSGVMAMPSLGAYAASKWALEGWSEAMRLELKASNIDVCLIEPGLIKTPLLDKNFSQECDPSSERYEDHKKLLSKFKNLNPHHFLRPEKVAEVIEKKIEQKHPKFRTLLSRLSKLKLMVRRLLPYSFYEKIILKSLGLNNID